MLGRRRHTEEPHDAITDSRRLRNAARATPSVLAKGLAKGLKLRQAVGAASRDSAVPTRDIRGLPRRNHVGSLTDVMSERSTSDAASVPRPESQNSKSPRSRLLHSGVSTPRARRDSVWGGDVAAGPIRHVSDTKPLPKSDSDDVSAGQRWFWCGGREGTRTPDLSRVRRAL